MTQSMEFELDGRHFRADRLSAKQQFHLSRKLAPLLPALAPLFLKAAALKDQVDPLSGNLLEFMALAEPFADALAELKTADADEIWDATLSSVKVETAATVWMPLWLPGANMAAEIELNELGKLLPIILRVITFNLGPFIDGFLTSREEPAVRLSGGISPVRKIG
jgi:hypothetical protein